MATKKQPLLDLDTTQRPERSVIRIDGEDYELRVMDDLSLNERLQFTQRTAKMGRMTNMGDMDSMAKSKMRDYKAADRLLFQAVQQVLDAPVSVIKKLNVTAMMEIVGLFTSAITADSEVVEMPPDLPTTTPPSPPSSDSTAELGESG